MKSVLVLISSFLLAGAVHGSTLLESRTQGDYVQNPTGTASFTFYSGCGSPGKPHSAYLQGANAECSILIACGKTASGYTAAMNQLAFGAPSGQGAGDACGRCFSVLGSADPHSPDNKGPFNSIVVKVTDLCSAQGNNEQWCGQTVSNPTNSFNQSVQCVISLFSLRDSRRA
jgi:hypothetical protein